MFGSEKRFSHHSINIMTSGSQVELSSRKEEFMVARTRKQILYKTTKHQNMAPPGIQE